MDPRVIISDRDAPCKEAGVNKMLTFGEGSDKNFKNRVF
jgi:hypothetical protein